MRLLRTRETEIGMDFTVLGFMGSKVYGVFFESE